MGNISRMNSVTWVFLFLFLVEVLTLNLNVLNDFQLNNIPDITKVNISQEEYSRMMITYLRLRKDSTNDDLKFITIDLDEQLRILNGVRMKFSINYNGIIKTENAVLKILVPPMAASGVSSFSASGSDIDSESVPFSSYKVQVMQVVGVRRRRLVEERVVYLSTNTSKWCEFDVTSAVTSWFNKGENFGLELICKGCKHRMAPQKAYLSALIYKVNQRKLRSLYQENRRTDCQHRRGGSKQKCCRHDMSVKLSDLNMNEMLSIIQPNSFDAGYCKGQCPPNYNHATNHSRIQSILHKMNRKNTEPHKKRVPKTCCAPSQLGPLEVLRVNPSDPSKLIVEKWNNMKVLECACS